jgi:hypothetical protein
MIKTRRMKWAGRVARLGRKAYTEFRWGNLREIDQLEEPGQNKMIILRWIFRKRDVGT